MKAIIIYLKNIQLKESIIPTKGEASGYQGLISITPNDNCKGIPKSLMKYICKIYPSEKIKDIENFEIKNNKLYANVPINTLKIQYKLDVIHTTDKIKHDENRALTKKQYLKFRRKRKRNIRVSLTKRQDMLRKQ